MNSNKFIKACNEFIKAMGQDPAEVKAFSAVAGEPVMKFETLNGEVEVEMTVDPLDTLASEVDQLRQAINLLLLKQDAVK